MHRPLRTRTLFSFALAALVVAACGGDDAPANPAPGPDPTAPDATDDTSGAPGEDTGIIDAGGEEDAGPDAPPTDDGIDDSAAPDTDEAFAVTWFRDIAPALDKHCGSCHAPGGQGVGNFRDVTVARAFAASMIGAVQAGRMPPPASDPACRDYINADRWVVPPEFTENLRQWMNDDYPMGDEADYVPVPPIPLRLDAPDLTLRMPHAYTPTFEDRANPGNEYRCFVLEHDEEEPFYITGMAPVIDQTELVHHIVLFKVRRDGIPDRNDPITGFDCIDMAFIGGSGGAGAIASGDEGMISAWAPGSQAIRFIDGAGIRMEPDHVLIMQMHYFNARPGEPLADQSGYEFSTAPAARTPVLMIPYGPTGFRIPAGAEAFVRRFTFSPPLALRIHGVMPHMHYLGQSYRMWYNDGGDEDECIVRSDRYDFNNQLTYMFETPLLIPRGAQLGFECTWNNSPSNPNLIHDPPIEIRYGENTDEEMCFGFALVSIGR